MTQPGQPQGQQQAQLFADSRVVSMFPTCVWVHDLKPADIESVNGQILPAIRALLAEQDQAAAEDNAIRQTRHDLQNDERFQGLLAFARRAAQGVLDFMQVDHSGFQITGCWANINPQGSSHRPHSHPNNYLSGVYYAQVPDESDGLVFHEPRAEALVMSPKLKKVTELTNSEARLGVRTGRLVVFPSWLKHSVAKTKGPGERISVSFNAMLSNFAEQMSPPRW
jgi:uncharacterized protein (TIGR02466 family)